jgi:hypothetical protein
MDDHKESKLKHRRELSTNALRWSNMLRTSTPRQARLLQNYQICMMCQAVAPFEEPVGVCPPLVVEDLVEALVTQDRLVEEQDQAWSYVSDALTETKLSANQAAFLDEIDHLENTLRSDFSRARLFSSLLATPHLQDQDRHEFTTALMSIMERLRTYSVTRDTPHHTRQLFGILGKGPKHSPCETEAFATVRARAYLTALSRGESLEAGARTNAERWTGEVITVDES